MTPAIAIVLMLVVGWYLPVLGRRFLGGRKGVWIGGALALAATIGVAWIVGTGVAAIMGDSAREEFDKGFNAWKLMILYIPAVCLHLSRKDKAAAASGDAAEASAGEDGRA